MGRWDPWLHHVILQGFMGKQPCWRIGFFTSLFQVMLLHRPWSVRLWSFIVGVVFGWFVWWHIFVFRFDDIECFWGVKAVVRMDVPVTCIFWVGSGSLCGKKTMFFVFGDFLYVWNEELCCRCFSRSLFVSCIRNCYFILPGSYRWLLISVSGLELTGVSRTSHPAAFQYNASTTGSVNKLWASSS